MNWITVLSQWDWNQWLPLVVLAVLAMGSWVVNTIKEEKEKREARQRIAASRSSKREPDESEDQPDSELFDEAARHRQQLEQLARKQTQTQMQRRLDSQDPTNLTMAEREQRSRAKAAYEQRAAALRGGETGEGRSAPQVRSTKAQPSSPRPTQTFGQRISQRRRIGQLAPLSSKQKLPSDTSLSRVGQKVATRLRDGVGQPQRRVSSSPKAASFSRSRLLKQLNGGSLRTAIVLKEILDRPLALRERDEMGG